MRCQAHVGVRYASNEEAEARRCPGNEAVYMGTAAWVSQTMPDLVADAQRMPEGQGHMYQCQSCKKQFYTVMGAKF